MSHRTDLSQAYFDLATMMDAGMPILRSIDVVIEGRRGYLKQIFKRIRETISKGATLAEALGRHPRMFPDLDRMLIEAAETSGAALFLTKPFSPTKLVLEVQRLVGEGAS